MVTASEIHSFLARNGISTSATVVVHTSMRSLGGVEGGCDGLIDGFISYLTDGLFLVPTHTWANVGSSQPIFDVRSTVPCIGALPAVAAFRKDGVRSLHPTHSVTVFGARAAEFVAGEENATSPCPAGGVWARLYEEDATILLIGVGLNRNTFLHSVDEALQLPHKLVDPIPLTIVDHDGVEHSVSFRKHGTTGSENYGNYRIPMAELGVLRYDRLGNAPVGICSARGAFDLVYRVLTRSPEDPVNCEKDIEKEYYL